MSLNAWFATALQDGHLSPGEAHRLHTISSAVPLPSPGGSDSDSEAHILSTGYGTASANGRSTSAEGDKSASNGDQIATTESAGSQRSDADSGSDASAISGMSGVSSVAPTEVQDAAEDQPNVPGRCKTISFSCSCMLNQTDGPCTGSSLDTGTKCSQNIVIG